jgi:two-component system, chemotaxis family, CheB/CheR fusion protein
MPAVRGWEDEGLPGRDITETKSARAEPMAVVGIGASAGGLDACARLVGALPADSGMAFVVVMHLDPTRESRIDKILAGVTPLDVMQVTRETRAEANTIYVIAPAASLHIRDGMLCPGEPREPRFHRKPIDDFFSSLAAAYGERAVGIVLSGAGDDGSAGLRDIRAAGGLCLVQDPEEAEYDGMPRSAIATGVADAVRSPEAMPELLLATWQQVREVPAPASDVGPPAREAPGGLGAVLALLGEKHGIDFRHYKTGTLRRRTERRMALLQMADWDAYLAHLREHPEEVAALYRDLLIGVTRFFRDPDSWQHLESQILPELIARHDDEEPVRVWVAGCATGEEAYGLVMLFLEGFERLGRSLNLRVYATDVSHEALAIARRGCYPSAVVSDIAPERLRRFFSRLGESYCVSEQLREAVTFAPHDLLSDPPFGRMDLVTCRNVLIYLDARGQQEVLDAFYFALRGGGLLWLGSSETVGRQSALFEPVSPAHRVYRASRGARLDRDRVPRWIGQHAPLAGGVAALAPVARTGPKLSRLLEQHVLEAHAPACVAVNQNLDILHFFGPTDGYLRQPRGEARFDLLSWVRPGIYTKLRIGLREAADSGRIVKVDGMRVEQGGETRLVEAAIEPVTSVPGAEGVLLVVFHEAPALPAELGPAGAEGAGEAATEALARHLEEELRQTQRELKSAVEELDSINEAYRASHEELISLNEELQSSNEELETSKEELQSLNEELITINRQLEAKNAELEELNADLKNLLASTGVPTVFLDRELRIRRFTPEAAQVMRVAPADIGRSMEDVRLLVADDSLLANARKVLESLAPSEAEIAGTDTSGDPRWFVRSITPYRTADDRIDGVCVTFREVTAQKRSTAESEQARRYAEAIVRASRTSLLVLDEKLRIESANPAFYETFRVSEAATVGEPLFDLGNHQWDIAKLRVLLDELLAEGGEVRDFDVEHTFEAIGWRLMRLNASVMTRPERPSLILLSIEDLTDLRRAEMAALARAHQLADEHQRKDEFIAMLGHELRNPLAAIANGLDLLRMKKALEPARAEQIVSMMSRQTRRIAAMLDELLDLARVISGKIAIDDAVVDLATVLTPATEAVATLIEREGHELVVSIPEAPVRVRGDAMRLAQVVENLLTNAAKYTDAGGTIWLTVDRAGDRARISVRDSGIGIEPELLPRIFELFVQDPRGRLRAQGGLGVGLPLVKHLVELHGGDVRAHSEGSGKGTEFVVTLPVAETPRTRPDEGLEQEPGERGARRERGAEGGAKILIIEDEIDVADALSSVLRAQNYEVMVARDGAAGLAAARRACPDVVLLDLALPDTDGYEVARALRQEHGQAMRIIATTGFPRDPARLDEAGFDAHLLKPIDPATLPERLASLTRHGERAGS